MQIWKSLHKFVFIWKQYPENIAFWILKMLELFTRKVCIFLQSRLLFNAFYCFCMFVKNISQISQVRISQKMKCVIMRNLRDTIFYMKTNVLQDFLICMSVPLNHSPVMHLHTHFGHHFLEILREFQIKYFHR